MESKLARCTIAISTLVIVATFFLFTAVPVLAQDAEPQEQRESQGKDVPPELQAKMQEFKQAAAGLRESGALLKADMREFKTGVRELLRKARTLSRDEKWDLIGQVSAARDEYLGTVEEKVKAIRENAGAMKEAIAGAREAWEQDDLDGALFSLDGAIAKAGELKVQLKEAHQLFQQILEVLRQLNEEVGAAPASAQEWAA